jgi:23S rRNA (pseudouridine1915-N3)-methyltransferase
MECLARTAAALQDRIFQQRSILAMHLIAIGRLRNGAEFDLFQRYNKRLRPPLTVVELPEGKGDALVVKRKEGAALLGAVPKGALIVPLDLGGHMFESDAFARLMRQWSGLSREICFLIGGAEGLDAPVINRADHLLSLGTMTWPHFLVRVMLAEQLYRAQAIAQGHPYHRASRPLTDVPDR